MTRLLVGPVLRYVGSVEATVWVETDGPCTVEILGHREPTWTVAGHHYALVHVTGLAEGVATAYDVALDGERVWPPPTATRPPPRIRTLPDGATRVRLAFGSCRYGRGSVTLSDRHFDADSLTCYAQRLADTPEADWPVALLMLGDQVYADETSVATRRRIAARRDLERGAGDQVADFEEYTWLYLESWTDPDVRWLLASLPSTMIFDDHDVRDDWNTSHRWRVEMQATDWWQERIVGGLTSYWVYQHLGNLTPTQLAADELYQQVRTGGGDAEALLREFATRADAEADGAKGARWSYRRDFGRTRLVMIDSRCGRILAEGRRDMINDAEFAWIEDQVADGSYDHLLIGTSLPWLLPRALHDLEAWDERLCDGTHGRQLARFGEWLRRAADLEHWASFHEGFERLGRLLADAAAGPRGPASVSVLSGDVHHAYVAEAHFDRPLAARVFQLTCSPLHNYVPPAMNVGFRLFWSRWAERFVRLLLGLVTAVPTPSLRWSRIAGPFFGNEIAEFTAAGRTAAMTLHKTERRPRRKDGDAARPPGLREVARVTLS